MALPNLTGIPPVDFKNLQALRAQTVEDGSLFDRIYPIFKKEAPELLDEIAKGFAKSDEEGTYEPMHKLKGSASAMGASRLFEIAQAGLAMCREGELFQQSDIVDQLKTEVANYIRTVDTLFPEYA